VTAAKQLVREVAGAAPDEALIERTVHAIAAIRASDEGREGVQAFLQRRRPQWLA
jgi:methylglutaconyl-CoA hydratase